MKFVTLKNRFNDEMKIWMIDKLNIKINNFNKSN